MCDRRCSEQGSTFAIAAWPNLKLPANDKKQKSAIFTFLMLFMQSATSVAIHNLGKDIHTLRRNSSWLFLRRRMFPGFRVGELLLWFLFHISWPIMAAIIYSLSGKFEDVKFMSLSQFALIQSVVITVKAICLLPFWWFYFVKLKYVRLPKKMALHFLTAPVYIILCILFTYISLVHILHIPYLRNARLTDAYNLMIIYFLHFALFHAYNFWLHTREQLKKEQELKELAYQSEIHALKSQIEPHFLFNTLNSISASVPPSLETTRVLIAQLADTFRYALRVNETQLVPLADELDFTKTWLALEQQRFGKRLHVEYKIDENALSLMVPPMLLQPLVENALNHGLADKLEGGTVTIECTVQKSSTIYIAVSDTGVGYDGNLEQMFDRGVGLSNTAKRLKLFYNENLSVVRQAEGLLFSFHLPIQPVYETKRINYRR
jgi:sensor histidine kinase YesM